MVCVVLKHEYPVVVYGLLEDVCFFVHGKHGADVVAHDPDGGDVVGGGDEVSHVADFGALVWDEG